MQDEDQPARPQLWTSDDLLQGRREAFSKARGIPMKGMRIGLVALLAEVLCSPPSPQPYQRRFIKSIAPIGATPKRAKVKAVRKQRKRK